MGYDIMIRIGRFPVQTPLGTQPGLGTQPCYKAACDLLVEIVKNAVINFGLVRLPLESGQKLVMGQPNSN